MFKQTLSKGIACLMVLGLLWGLEAKSQGTETLTEEQKGAKGTQTEIEVGTESAQMILKEPQKGTKTLWEKEAEELSDEEFAKKVYGINRDISIIPYKERYDKNKGKYVYKIDLNNFILKELKIELGLSDTQMEVIKKFFEIKSEWENLECDLMRMETSAGGVADIEWMTEREKKELLETKIKAYEKHKKKYKEKKPIVINQVKELRKILENKQNQFLDWFEIQGHLYNYFIISEGDYLQSEKKWKMDKITLEKIEDNFIKKDYLKNKRVEMLSNMAKDLNLTSTQQAKIEKILKNYKDEILKLRIRLIALERNWLESPTISDEIIKIIQKKSDDMNNQIKKYLTNEQKSKFRRF